MIFPQLYKKFNAQIRMKSIAKKLFRIGYIILVLLLGAGISIALTKVSNQSKGPISSLFDNVNLLIQKTEENLIVKKRENPRQDRIPWFNTIKNDIVALRNPSKIMVGIHDNKSLQSFEEILTIEDSLQVVFPLIHLYVAWGDKTEHNFPKSQAQAIRAMGSIPVITWEPWLTAFEGENYLHLRKKEIRDAGGMKDVANGLYDNYIIQWAQDIKNFKTPIFIRFAHEMNDPNRYPWGPQNNEPSDFVKAWKHVWNIFNSIGAKNVLWVWTPHLSYGYIKYFYPGDEFVDYIGLDILNFGTIASWSKWYTFSEILDNHYKELEAYKKPIMIAELGSLVYGGDRPTWYKEALATIPTKYPAIKSVMFFHVSEDKTTTKYPLNWCFKNDVTTKNVISAEIKKWYSND